MRLPGFMRKLSKAMNWWPPFLGAGIKIRRISPDRTTVDVEMKQKKWNTNVAGSHYGGSIFSMTDPFYALILVDHLGRDYLIVDKDAEIKFKKMGKGKLTASFNISAQRIAEIKNEADTRNKSEPKFIAIVRDENGDVVAEVKKTVYVRRKPSTTGPKP